MLSPLLLDLLFGRGAVAILRAFEIPALSLQCLLAVAQSLILFSLPLFQRPQVSFRSLKRFPRRARPRFRFRLRWR
jgi:hypothetical protein